MGKFDIGSFAASLSDAVSRMDDSSEVRIQYIDIGRLDAHEENFYKLSALEQLVDSIAMDGLQQPIVVVPGEDNRYTVISGHRRRAAIGQLVDEGRDDLRQVPCLVKNYQSKALAELQLIMANSTARILTSAEVMRQAQRTEELLHALKEEGYVFPGRMRDQVAKACAVSASKLARLKVIRDKLIEPWMEEFEAGRIAEDVAYTIARQSQDCQWDLSIFYICTFWSVTATVIEGWLRRIEEISSIQCADGAACTNRERMLEATARISPQLGLCRKCCRLCAHRATCKYLCPIAKEQETRGPQETQQLPAEPQPKPETQADQRAAKAERDRQRWKRLGQEFKRTGVSRSDAAVIFRCAPDEVETLNQLLYGEPPKQSPDMWPDIEDELWYAMTTLTDAGVSLDYVLTGARGLAEKASQWQRGRPTKNGYYWVIHVGTVSGGKLYWWQDDHWELAYAMMEVGVKPEAWMPCPELPDWASWERVEP